MYRPWMLTPVPGTVASTLPMAAVSAASASHVPQTADVRLRSLLETSMVPLLNVADNAQLT
jgi:hypothetical protein